MLAYLSVRAQALLDNGDAAAGELLTLAADPAAETPTCLAATKVRYGSSTCNVAFKFPEGIAASC